MKSKTDQGSRAMDFHGSLDEFHLPDIIQFLSGAGKTGALRLAAAGREGVVYLEGGRIHHAVFQDIAGEEAVYSLLLLTSGKFDFEPGETTATSTVSRSNANLLIEAARRKDEWDVISERIRSVDCIPEFVLPGDDDVGRQITLNTSEWVVLSKIDGQRSVKEIARASNLSIFQACRLLYSLVSTDLIRLRVPDSGEEDAVGFPD